MEQPQTPTASKEMVLTTYKSQLTSLHISDMCVCNFRFCMNCKALAGSENVIFCSFFFFSFSSHAVLYKQFFYTLINVLILKPVENQLLSVLLCIIITFSFG